MAGTYLSERVRWHSIPAPLWRRGARWLPSAVLLLVELLGPGGAVDGPALRDPKVGPDRTVQLGGDVRVKGTGSGMPDRYPGWQMVTVYVDQATITPGLVEIDLPLAALTPVEARRVGLPWTRRKAVDAMWQIRVTGAGTDLTFRGSWLFLAQLGTLGNWPEPS